MLRKIQKISRNSFIPKDTQRHEEVPEEGQQEAGRPPGAARVGPAPPKRLAPPSPIFIFHLKTFRDGTLFSKLTSVPSPSSFRSRKEIFVLVSAPYRRVKITPEAYTSLWPPPGWCVSSSTLDHGSMAVASWLFLSSLDLHWLDYDLHLHWSWHRDVFATMIFAMFVGIQGSYLRRWLGLCL